MTFDSDTDHRLLLRRTKSDRPLFCFTLDTEPDGLWQDNGVTFQHFDRLFDLHKDLVRCGARPTYLTTSEVAEDRQAAREMKRILEGGDAELAAHFHTWTRSWPFPVPEFVNPQTHACAHQLGQDLVQVSHLFQAYFWLTAAGCAAVGGWVWASILGSGGGEHVVSLKG